MLQGLKQLSGWNKFFAYFNLVAVILIGASIFDMQNFEQWGAGWGWSYQSYPNYIFSSVFIGIGIAALTFGGIYFADKCRDLSSALLSFYAIYLLAYTMLSIAGFITDY